MICIQSQAVLLIEMLQLGQAQPHKVPSVLTLHVDSFKNQAFCKGDLQQKSLSKLSFYNQPLE